MNICLNLVNANLAPGVRNSDPELDFVSFTKFLDLAGFFLVDLAPTLLLLPPTLLMVLFSLKYIEPLTKWFTFVVHNIKVSRAAMRLKPWMKRW